MVRTPRDFSLIATILTMVFVVSVRDLLSQDAPATRGWTWQAQAEAVLLRPIVSDNTAFTIRSSDGATFERLETIEFDSDLKAGYRLSLGGTTEYGLGIRGGYFHWDGGTSQRSSRPPANGFGAIEHPSFGDVDISSTIPQDAFAATRSLDASTAHGELTYQHGYELWDCGIGMGVESSSLEQHYQAQLTNDQVGLVGNLDSRRHFRGTGPTLVTEVRSSILRRVDLFGSLRGSLLFGKNQWDFQGGEDLDLQPSLITTEHRSSASAITRLTGTVGTRLMLIQSSSFQCSSFVGLEGQTWLGSGTAQSAEGNLGLFGMTLGLEVVRR